MTRWTRLVYVVCWRHRLAIPLLITAFSFGMLLTLIYHRSSYDLEERHTHYMPVNMKRSLEEADTSNRYHANPPEEPTWHKQNIVLQPLEIKLDEDLEYPSKSQEQQLRDPTKDVHRGNGTKLRKKPPEEHLIQAEDPQHHMLRIQDQVGDERLGNIQQSPPEGKQEDQPNPKADVPIEYEQPPEEREGLDRSDNNGESRGLRLIHEARRQKQHKQQQLQGKGPQLRRTGPPVAAQKPEDQGHINAEMPRQPALNGRDSFHESRQQHDSLDQSRWPNNVVEDQSKADLYNEKINPKHYQAKDINVRNPVNNKDPMAQQQPDSESSLPNNPHQRQDVSNQGGEGQRPAPPLQRNHELSHHNPQYQQSHGMDQPQQQVNRMGQPQNNKIYQQQVNRMEQPQNNEIYQQQVNKMEQPQNNGIYQQQVNVMDQRDIHGNKEHRLNARNQQQMNVMNQQQIPWMPQQQINEKEQSNQHQLRPDSPKQGHPVNQPHPLPRARSQQMAAQPAQPQQQLPSHGQQRDGLSARQVERQGQQQVQQQPSFDAVLQQPAAAQQFKPRGQIPWQQQIQGQIPQQQFQGQVPQQNLQGQIPQQQMQGQMPQQQQNPSEWPKQQHIQGQLPMKQFHLNKPQLQQSQVHESQQPRQQVIIQQHQGQMPQQQFQFHGPQEPQQQQDYILQQQKYQGQMPLQQQNPDQKLMHNHYQQQQDPGKLSQKKQQQQQQNQGQSSQKQQYQKNMSHEQQQQQKDMAQQQPYKGQIPQQKNQHQLPQQQVHLQQSKQLPGQMSPHQPQGQMAPQQPQVQMAPQQLQGQVAPQQPQGQMAQQQPQGQMAPQQPQGQLAPQQQPQGQMAPQQPQGQMAPQGQLAPQQQPLGQMVQKQQPQGQMVQQQQPQGQMARQQQPLGQMVQKQLPLGQMVQQQQPQGQMAPQQQPWGPMAQQQQPLGQMVQQPQPRGQLVPQPWGPMAQQQQPLGQMIQQQQPWGQMVPQQQPQGQMAPQSQSWGQMAPQQQPQGQMAPQPRGQMAPQPRGQMAQQQQPRGQMAQQQQPQGQMAQQQQPQGQMAQQQQNPSQILQPQQQPYQGQQQQGNPSHLYLKAPVNERMVLAPGQRVSNTVHVQAGRAHNKPELSAQGQQGDIMEPAGQGGLSDTRHMQPQNEIRQQLHGAPLGNEVPNDVPHQQNNHLPKREWLANKANLQYLRFDSQDTPPHKHGERMPNIIPNIAPQEHENLWFERGQPNNQGKVARVTVHPYAPWTSRGMEDAANEVIDINEPIEHFVHDIHSRERSDSGPAARATNHTKQNTELAQNLGSHSLDQKTLAPAGWPKFHHNHTFMFDVRPGHKVEDVFKPHHCTELFRQDQPDLFNLWEEQATSFCDDKVVAYYNEFALWNDIIMDLNHAHGRHGGEEIMSVLNQPEEDEYYQFSYGFFKITCQEKPNYFFQNNNHNNQWLIGLETVPEDSFKVDSTSQEFTIAVTRYEYANIYHTMTDFYNAFLLMEFFNKTQSDTHILIVDGHPKGALDTVWPALFKSAKRISEYPKTTFFKDLAWGILGYDSPMMDHYAMELPLIEEFRTFFLKTYSIPDNHKIDCDHINILFIWRRDYLAHPRNPKGTISRKIQNEQELVQTLRDKFPTYNIRGVQIDLFEMQQQLLFVSQTDILIGMHGAGLTHAMFLPKTAALLELLPVYWSSANEHFQAIARWRHLHYERWTNTDPMNESPDFFTVVPPEVLNEMVNEMVHAMCKAPVTTKPEPRGFLGNFF